LNTRSSGILIHPTSFTSKYGCGDLGDGAFKIIDFLKSSGQKILQILPLGPTGFGNSPYQSFSSFAGNPYLISFDVLFQKGLLTKADLEDYPLFNKSKINYGFLFANNFIILNKAFYNFKKNKNKDDYLKFKKENSYWLKDYSLFMAIKENLNGASWDIWDNDIKNRVNLTGISKKLKDRVEFYSFIQWQFYFQWRNFLNYAHSNDIKIIGDMPIFVSYDSVEVWANKELFSLDEHGNPLYVAGVPPDYFSETGQLWGNPVYKWELMKENNFEWWKKRIKHILNFVDCVRIDHFRGFESYWQIPFGEETAINGKWIKAPGFEFFSSLKDEFGDELSEKIIAEDLGIITDEIKKLRDQFNISGMRVFEFVNFPNTNNKKQLNVFKNDLYLPENYIENCIAYSGTHDNNTLMGWFESLENKKQQFILDYLEINDNNKLSEAVIYKLAKSKANRVIFLMQDILRLQGDSRMNLPGTCDNNNWTWRIKEGHLSCENSENLYNITRATGRI